MDAARNQPDSQAPVALVILTVIVYVAGFAMVASWFALLVLGQPAAPPDGANARSFACGVCGVVERVGEFERKRFELSGDPGESLVVVLAALGGLKSDPAPSRVYETEVRHDDGSVRVVRDSSAPQWKNGDRVRVVRGRVEMAGR